MLTLEVQDQTKNGFLDDPRKGFPTTKGQCVVFGLPGHGKPQKGSLQNKKRWFSSMDNAVCTYSRLHRGRNQSWKCNADNETTSSSLLHGCSIFGKGCKGQTKNYMERCLHVGAYTHISNHINESKDFLVNNRMMHFACFIHRRIVSALTRKRALIEREMPPPTMKVNQ